MVKFDFFHYGTTIVKWQIVDKKTPFSGYFQVDEYVVEFERFDGGMNQVNRELFERGSAAGVLPYDPDQDLVLLIEQFRVGAMFTENPWLIEPIAGVIDKVGQPPEEVARKEALEEAGCELSQLIPVADYFVTPGVSTEYLNLYCAPTTLSLQNHHDVHGLPEEGENIRVHIISREESMDWLKSGKVKNAAAVVCLQWLALNYQDIRT